MRFPFWDTPLTVRAAFLFLLLTAVSTSANAKDLSDLFAAMDTQSVAIARARTELADVQRQYQASRAIPNPTLGYDHERISTNDATEKETVLTLTQSLGFLWSYGASRTSAKHALNAATLGFDELRRELYVQAAEASMDVQSANRRLSYSDTVLARTRSLVTDMTKRFELGDVSEYDLNRLQAELVLLKSEQRELVSKRQAAAIAFTQLSGLPASWCDDLSAKTSLEPPFRSEDEAADYALKNRPLLKKAKANQQAADSYHAAAKRNQLPDISATIGRKTVSPSFDGIVVGAEIELPVFSQKRSETRYARAKTNESRLIHDATTTKVDQEARQAFQTWQHMTAENPSRMGNAADLLTDLDRGILMYAHGELSAAEFVDVLRSGADVLAAQHELNKAKLLSALELRRTTGLPLEGEQ